MKLYNPIAKTNHSGYWGVKILLMILYRDDYISDDKFTNIFASLVPDNIPEHLGKNPLTSNTASWLFALLHDLSEKMMFSMNTKEENSWVEDMGLFLQTP